MPTLIVHDPLTGSHTFALKAGVNRVGRVEGNDVLISDPSVSSRHCELCVEESGITILDSGSTNGTFVDGSRVAQITISQSRSMQFGSVNAEIQMEPISTSLGEPPAVFPGTLRIGIVNHHDASSPSMPLLAPTYPANDDTDGAILVGKCRTHREISSTYICQSCGSELCKLCVKAAKVPGVLTRMCPLCSGLCKSVAEHRRSAEQTRLSQATYSSLAGPAFAYPFKDGGVFMILTAAVMLSFWDFAGFIRLRGFSFWFLTVFIVGYCASYLQRVIQASMQADSKVPGWPDFSSWTEDILDPFLKFSATLAMCLGPAFFLLLTDQGGVAIAMGLLGMLCMPMALLTISAADSYSGLNPLHIFSAITRIPGPYLLTCVLFLVIIGFRWIMSLAMEGLGGGIWVVAMFACVGNVVFFYSLMVQMRLLGLLYYTNRKTLGWFE